MSTAFQYFSSCVEIASENQFGGIEVVNSSMIGFTRKYLNQLSEALEDGLKTIIAANNVGNQRAEMLAEMLVTLVLFEMADYAGSRQHNSKSIELSQQLGATRFEAQALLYEGKLNHVEGRREDAVKALNLGLKMSESVGHAFVGPRIMCTLAQSLDGAEEKRQALDEGERMLEAGSVSHNHLFFYPQAIDTSLETGSWDHIERYASALEAFTRPEPLPWSDFFITRGRALAAYGRGERDDTLLQELRRLKKLADQAGLKTATPSIESALAAM